MMVGGIYCIENANNGKKYIGSSIDVYKRRNRHFSELKCGKHKNIKLQSSFNKHGLDNFKFYVLEEVSEKTKLIEREQYYIDKHKPEYNINLIANSSLGVKRSKETIEKVRKANLGLKHPEWRNKIKSKSQGGKNHWTKKKSFSEKAKKKMSKTHKKLYDDGYISPVSVSICEVTEFGDVIKEWSSILKAAKYYNVDAMTIRNLLTGKTKNSRKLKGKFFKYGN